MSVGEAIRCWAMSQPMLTMWATTRWATNPALSRITLTGRPAAARAACTQSIAARSVVGVVHQGDPPLETEQRIDRDRALRIEMLRQRGMGRIVAKWCDHADRARGRSLTFRRT